MGTLALIGLGSNLGDRKAQLDAAVVALGEGRENIVRAVSSYHETAPVGGPAGQGAFLNAAAAVETTLDPTELLRVLHDIERHAGRVRILRWGERTLDLDLLLFGDRVIGTFPTANRVFGGQFIALQIPHPRMTTRRFVLDPLAEIAPAAVDPLSGRTIADLLANLDRRPSLVTIYDPNWSFYRVTPLADALYSRLVESLHAVGLTYATQREAFGKEFHLKVLSSLSGSERNRRLEEMTGARRRLLETWIEQYCRDLSIEAESTTANGDRWLVSDFWLDAVFEVPQAPDEAPANFLDRLLEARAKVIAPTFVVVPRGCCRSLSRAECPWPAPLGDTPILDIDPNADPEIMAAEVLTACRATRTG